MRPGTRTSAKERAIHSAVSSAGTALGWNVD